MTQLSPATSAASPKALELACPACTQTLRVEAHDQVEGTTVHCARCGADAELVREYDERLDKSHWLLVEPQPDDESARH